MYVFVGTKAPLSTRFECVRLTEQRLTKKFEQPLDFDRMSKQQIKGYWVWSLLRQCLHEKGYDTKGIVLPKSSVTKENSNEKTKETLYTYKNPEGMIYIASQSEIIIREDNKLDTEFDNRLLQSTLKIGEEEAYLHIYHEYEDYTNLLELSNNLQNFLTVKNPTNIKVFALDNGNEVLKFEDAKVTAYMLMLPNNILVHIFSENPEIALKLAEGVTFLTMNY